MIFVGRTPKEGINITDVHPAKEALTLIAGLAGILAVIIALTVFFIDIVILFISPETEARLFSNWNYSELLSVDYEHKGIPELEDLTQRLARHWPEGRYEFRIGVLDEAQPNAVALPGGTILVTRGLIEQVESENELAFVLAHEIGHFKNRDHLRMLGRGAALGIVFVAISGQDGGFVSQGVLEATTRSFGRRQETAADLFALELVQAEFGHVADAWRFFERLAEQRAQFEGIANYFSTHPASEDRIEQLRERALAEGWPLSGQRVPLAF